MTIKHVNRNHDVTDWLKNREAQETLGNYREMLCGRPRLQQEFAAIYHDRYGKAHGVPETLIKELLNT